MAVSYSLNDPDGAAWWSASPTLLGGTPSTSTVSLSQIGPVLSVLGGIQSAFGSYFSTQSQQSALKFQASMAKINARAAETSAQSILDAGQKAVGRQTMIAGKVKASQTASFGARGIQGGAGSAAEEIATTDLMKETDALTINANAVRQAWAARTQGVNAQNEALLAGTSARSLNPFASAATSLVGSAADVASGWYRMKRQAKIAAALGVE